MAGIAQASATAQAIVSVEVLRCRGLRGAMAVSIGKQFIVRQ